MITYMKLFFFWKYMNLFEMKDEYEKQKLLSRTLFSLYNSIFKFKSDPIQYSFMN